MTPDEGTESLRVEETDEVEGGIVIQFRPAPHLLYICMSILQVAEPRRAAQAASLPMNHPRQINTLGLS